MAENIMNPQQALHEGYISVKEAQEITGKAEITIRRFLRKAKEGGEGIPPNASIQVKRAGGKKHYTYVHREAILQYFGLSIPEEKIHTKDTHSDNHVEVEVEPMEHYQNTRQTNTPPPESAHETASGPQSTTAMIPIHEHKDIINQFVIKLNEAVEKEHAARAQLTIAENNVGHQSKELQRIQDEAQEKQQRISQLHKKQNILLGVAALFIGGVLLWSNNKIASLDQEHKAILKASEEELKKSLIESAKYKSVADIQQDRVGELSQKTEEYLLKSEALKLKLHQLEEEKRRLEKKTKDMQHEIEILSNEPSLEPIGPQTKIRTR